MRLFFRIQIILFLLLILPIFWVAAESSMNAICYVRDAPGEVVQGYKVDDLFEVASVSKIVVSYWAITELGPDFRFDTRIHITPVGDQIYDVHIQGSQDPFWGRQMTHFLFSELNRIGVYEIRNLSFDENLKMRWKVLIDFVDLRNPSASEIKVSLENHLANLQKEYFETFSDAAKAKVRLSQHIRLSVKEVQFLSMTDFYHDSSSTRTFSLNSAPLFRYLKEMNSVSNNHVADKLYDYLGGSAAFDNFVFQNLSSSNIHFINGSGNSLTIGNDKSGREIKGYNRASCQTIVNVTRLLQQRLQKDGNFDLKDIMAVSSSDESTLTPGYSAIPNSLVAKTGTVDPAVAISGRASANRGDIYFGVFYRTSGPADWSTARRRVREHVFGLFRQFGGARNVAYSARVFLPFDEESFFKESSHNGSMD